MSLENRQRALNNRMREILNDPSTSEEQKETICKQLRRHKPYHELPDICKVQRFNVFDAPVSAASGAITGNAALDDLEGGRLRRRRQTRRKIVKRRRTVRRRSKK